MVSKIITSRSFLLNCLSKENIQHTMYATKHNHLKYLQSQNKNTSQYPNNFGHFPKQAKELYPLARRSVCRWKKLKKKRTLLKTVLNVLVHKMNQFFSSYIAVCGLFIAAPVFCTLFILVHKGEHFETIGRRRKVVVSDDVMMAIKN